jgi:hypothetical protein
MVGELSSDDTLVVDGSLVAASLGEALVSVDPSSIGDPLVGAELSLGESVAAAEPPLGEPPVGELTLAEPTLAETLVAKGRTLIYYVGGFISLQVAAKLIPRS